MSTTPSVVRRDIGKRPSLTMKGSTLSSRYLFSTFVNLTWPKPAGAKQLSKNNVIDMTNTCLHMPRAPLKLT